jgi:hypothetical protein
VLWDIPEIAVLKPSVHDDKKATHGNFALKGVVISS